jgi:N-acetylated-alpha-linked acidic dipeptidase
LRFADAELLPLDYSIYAAEVAAYLEGLEKLAPADFNSHTIQPLIAKCRRWQEVAAKTTAVLEAWRTGSPALPNAARERTNAALMAQERALLDERGIPGRPWFRHLIYAPLPSYEAESLPGLREALEAQDLERARDAASRLSDALDRAIAALAENQR